MTTNKIEKSDHKGVLAIQLNPEQEKFLKRAVEKSSQSGAHIGRVALMAACASVLGEAAPEVLESKKGPKAGAKLNPLAAKANISNAELLRRMKVYTVDQGLTLKQLEKIDWAVDPKPVKHREPKVETPATTTTV